MSTRGNPFEELERLSERMSRQFDDASRMWERTGPFAWWTQDEGSLSIDLIEHDDEFVVAVDLPGFERDDVSIRVTDHQLRIEAEQEGSLDEEQENYIRHERSHQSMRRSVRLPDEVDTESVSAEMRNGVLTVTLPKREDSEARTIDIE